MAIDVHGQLGGSVSGEGLGFFDGDAAFDYQVDICFKAYDFSSILLPTAILSVLYPGGPELVGATRSPVGRRGRLCDDLPDLPHGG